MNIYYLFMGFFLMIKVWHMLCDPLKMHAQTFYVAEHLKEA